MPDEEKLVVAFTEGRISRRAFVRQLVDGGMSMPTALAYAEALSPADASGVDAHEAAAAAGGDGAGAPLRGMAPRPAQVDGLAVTFVGDGYTVYDPRRDRMHSLNNVAALVLELCTGENDAAAIAALLQQAFQLPEVPLEETQYGLTLLFDEELIR